MKISWFPGHMNKTRKALAKLLNETDVLIEVLDARMPNASHNPLFDEWQGQVTTLHLLNKTDLADPKVTKAWEQTYMATGKHYQLIQANQLQLKAQLIKTIRSIAPPNRGTVANPIRVLIIGVPNVGKSTLLNHLLSRKFSKVGDTPAVTRDIKRVKLEEGVVLYDSPGVMWTNPASETCGYILALCAAIADTAYEYPDVAAFAIEYLSEYYPDSLIQRYKLTNIDSDPVATMEAIGRQQHLVKGKSVDWEKIARRIIADFRSGLLGRISLESPDNQ